MVFIYFFEYLFALLYSFFLEYVSHIHDKNIQKEQDFTV